MAEFSKIEITASDPTVAGELVRLQIRPGDRIRLVKTGPDEADVAETIELQVEGTGEEGGRDQPWKFRISVTPRV